MTSDAPRLRARGVTQRFGARLVLDGADLEIDRGEVLSLFGANGAGKSTLLRILALIARPDAGELSWNGRAMRRGDAEMRARIGLLGHSLGLYETLTIAENLRLFARLYALEASYVGAAIERFDLGRRAEDRIDELSRGWQQRTALARSTLHRPELWLLDEPFAGLDRRASATLAAAIRDHAAAGGSALVVTHDIVGGLEVATHWTTLRGGALEPRRATCSTSAVEVEGRLD